jgi:F-type H+-transporting ATPase subunit a
VPVGTGFQFMISLAPEILFSIGSFPVTNTVIDTLFVDAIILGIVLYIHKKHSVVPTFFQTIIELIMEQFYSLTESTAGKYTMQIFPFVMSFFLFILVANYSELIPVITSIYIHKGNDMIPLMRSASSDLNLTLALALISVVTTHAMGIRATGFKTYLHRFFSAKPLELYSGLLELISEFTKLISFSFRLFGNIFVGGIMLSSITAFFAYVLPVAVLFDELFVGFIQAAIFALLTMAFMSIFTTSHSMTD